MTRRLEIFGTMPNLTHMSGFCNQLKMSLKVFRSQSSCGNLLITCWTYLLREHWIAPGHTFNLALLTLNIFYLDRMRGWEHVLCMRGDRGSTLWTAVNSEVNRDECNRGKNSNALRARACFNNPLPPFTTEQSWNPCATFHQKSTNEALIENTLPLFTSDTVSTKADSCPRFCFNLWDWKNWPKCFSSKPQTVRPLSYRL